MLKPRRSSHVALEEQGEAAALHVVYQCVTSWASGQGGTNSVHQLMPIICPLTSTVHICRVISYVCLDSHAQNPFYFQKESRLEVPSAPGCQALLPHLQVELLRAMRWIFLVWSLYKMVFQLLWL